MPQDLIPDKDLKRAYELCSIIKESLKKQFKIAEERFVTGIALKELRDDKFYKKLGYDNFEACTLGEFEMSVEYAYYYIQYIERFSADFLRRVVKMDKPISFRRMHQLGVTFEPIPETLQALSAEDIERLRDMPDSEFEKEMKTIRGYDRSKDSGRGPSDLDRPHISRDRYRDQRNTISGLKAERDTLKAEKKELLKELETTQNYLQEAQHVLQSEDRTKALAKVNEVLTEKIAEYEKNRAESEVKKQNRELATQLIYQLRFDILQKLIPARNDITIPNLEVWVWMDMTFYDIIADVERVRDALAHDFLEEIDKLPLIEGDGSAAAMRLLSKELYPDVEAALRAIVGQPGVGIEVLEPPPKKNENSSK